MTNYGITVENLLRTFPDALKEDNKLYALASIVAKLLSSRPEEIDSLRIYPQIKNLPESLLDILAYDFKIDWYGYNFELSIKKSQIKDSFNVHQTLGTRGSIEKALRDIYPGTEVEEWFDYNSDPYYFRVFLDVTDHVASHQAGIPHDELVRAINIFKPIRSRLQNNAIMYKSRVYVDISVTSNYTKFGYTLAGTVPDTNTVGGIGRNEITIEANVKGSPFEYRLAGTGAAGEVPDINTIGKTKSGSILPSILGEGSIFDYQLCGETEDEI